jgi:hypothetical protein
MARTLIVVAGTGIAVSVISLSLASFVSPGDGRWPVWAGIGERGWWDPFGRWTDGAPFIEPGEMVSREYPWDGSDSVVVDIPGVVQYAPAPAWKVTATGRQSALEHLRIDAGRIYFDGSRAAPGASSVEVRIEGPSLTTFALNGSGDVVLDDINQQQLEIEIRGSGSVRGAGSVGNLDLAIVGSGDADLADVITGDADVGIVGSGDADIAPTGDTKVRIVGSGDARLRTRPRSLSANMVGSGRVTQLEAGEAGPSESSGAGRGP